MKPTQLRWGVIGTGAIASDFAEALAGSERCTVVNVCGSSPEKAQDFAAKWRLPAAARSLAELLADPTLEAVYVATPHPFHEAHASAAIDAGKHVLCEKPFALDAPSAARVIERARLRGVFLMEAFMYRCHPLLHELTQRLRAGAIGAIRHVRADFGFRVARDPQGRLFDAALAGGAILDVGGYPMSLARLIAGLCEGRPFAEPESLQGAGYIGPTSVDEFATALVRFRSGLTAALTCALRHDVGTECILFGENGRIVLPNPWLPGGQRHGRETHFELQLDGRAPETVRVRTSASVYALEAELVADSLPATEPAWPAMTWADSMGNMRALDAWRASLTVR